MTVAKTPRRRRARVSPRAPVARGLEHTLSSLRLRNFKSFVDETIPFGPLTLFVGGNGSGKSNALDALRFLQGLALGHTVLEVLEGRVDGDRVAWPGLRGGGVGLYRHGQLELEIESCWRLERMRYKHAVGCFGAAVVTESLTVEDASPGRIFSAEDPLLAGGGGPSGSLVLTFQDCRGRTATVQRPGTGTVLAAVVASKGLGPAELITCSAAQTAMRRVAFLEAGRPTTSSEPAGDDRELSVRLWRLCLQPAWKRRVLEWLSELSGVVVRDITFLELADGGVMPRLVEESGGAVELPALSDGTRRFLELLVALFGGPASIVVIEAIESGLHPQRLHLLVELLEAAAAERGIQVIGTTHSPLVLMALSKQALADAVVFARADGQPGTVARRLGNLPDFDEVSERRGVDRLFASGWLERAL